MSRKYISRDSVHKVVVFTMWRHQELVGSSGVKLGKLIMKEIDALCNRTGTDAPNP